MWLNHYKKLLQVVLNSLQQSLSSNSQGKVAKETLDDLLTVLENAKKLFTGKDSENIDAAE